MATKIKKAVLKGQLLGIDWGHGPCSTVVFMTFPNKTGSFISALKKLCDNGDFANCKLSADTIIEVTFSTSSGRKSTQFTKTFTITEFPSAAAFITNRAYGTNKFCL